MDKVYFEYCYTMEDFAFPFKCKKLHILTLCKKVLTQLCILYIYATPIT